MANEQYKFPDEIEVHVDDDELEVGVIDDTPEEDRDRAPLSRKAREELDNDDLTEYSDKVRKRINQARKAYHDERREKEQSGREREEAVRFAQQAYQENQQLRQRLGVGERVFINEVSKAAVTELGAAKEKLRRAYESGDVNDIADAQEMMTDAKLRIRELENLQPTLQGQEPSVQNIPQVQQQPVYQPPAQVVDRKAEFWQRNNEWFGQDPEMTALALGKHEQLVKEGVDPRSDDYYDEINSTMKRRFPEKFRKQNTGSNVTPQRRSSVVAPATRSTAPRQVRLTTTQVALAKQLGITNEAYARELIKLENSND